MRRSFSSGRFIRSLAAMAALLPIAAALAVDEVEPNDSKADALANGPIVLNAGDVIVGNTVAATGAGIDCFLVQTGELPPAIYRHRLILTSETTGHIATLRALNQVAVTAGGWPGPVGTAGATDSTAQTAASGVVQWYGFGQGEQIYYRVTGTAATTADYIVTLETEQVFNIGDCGVWQPGAITISTVPPGHANDVDLMVYDSNFEPIPGYANDGATVLGGHTTGTNIQAFLKRHYEPGVYYIALSNFDLMNNLGSPADDNRRTGLIMDFPGSVVSGSATAPVHLHFTMTDALGSTQFADGLVVSQFNTTKTNPFEVRWHRFTVAGNEVGACCLPDGTCAVTTHGRCELVLEGSFNGMGTGCELCPELPTGQWFDRAPAPYARVGAAGAIVGDHFYLIGGSNPSGVRSTDCYKYDIIQNTWTGIAPLPHSGSGAPQLGGISNIDAAAIGTDIYVVGGFIGHASTVPPIARLLKYDTLTDTWEEIATDPYPTPIYGAGVAARGGKLYVVSGATLASPLTLTPACHVYDPQAPAGSRWSAIAPLPTARMASVAVVNDRLYAVASGDAAIDATRVDVYDFATDAWSPAPDLGAPRAACAVYDYEGRVYASSGGLTTYLATGEVLDAGVWTSGPTVVHGMRSMAFDGAGQWLVRSTGYNGAYRPFTEILRTEGTTTPTGACCIGTGCIISTEQSCTGNGWVYLGDHTFCSPDPCGTPATGACCDGVSCTIATSADCAAGGGVYQGDGTECGAPGNPTTCCTANFDGMNGVAVPDIFAFLSAWFAASPSADVDGVPGVTVPDIFAFLSMWFAGCPG